MNQPHKSIFYILFCVVYLNVSGQQRIQTRLSEKETRVFIKESNSELLIGEFKLGAYIVSELSNGTNKPPNQNWKGIDIPGVFSLGGHGYPHLPTISKLILVPEGARVKLKVQEERVEYMDNIEIGPREEARSTSASDNQGIVYQKNQMVYQKNDFFPVEAVEISEVFQIRGYDVVRLTIYPIQYHPIDRKIKIHVKIDFQLDFVGGSGKYGEERLKNPYWDQLLKSMLFNADALQLSITSYRESNRDISSDGADYLIIRPNGNVFQQYADSIKNYRQEQGIQTKVVGLDEIGGNDFNLIEAYIENAYNNWIPAPAAVLFLGDHGDDPENRLTSYLLTGHPYPSSDIYPSDNQYVDVDEDHLPEMVASRITARDSMELAAVFKKIKEYEMNPSIDPDFYNHPTSALGWQDNTWFQVAGENFSGYFEYKRGRNPNREYAIYSGDPLTGSWKTTSSLVSYWGPDSLGYLTATPNPEFDWVGGNAARISEDINNGTFFMQHHDHGFSGGLGWAIPQYLIYDIDALQNTSYPFVVSMDCSSGKYMRDDSFAEKFLRHHNNGNPHGAIGVIASSDVAYMQYGEVYTWGVYNYLWPDFMPGVSSNPNSGHLYSAFANMAAKFYLANNSFKPYNSWSILTNNLFHHHGDAFLTLYDTVPQMQLAQHSNIVSIGMTHFEVLADSGALMTISYNNQILDHQMSTGALSSLLLSPYLRPGDTLILKITNKNAIPYRRKIPVEPFSGSFTSFLSYEIEDSGLNEDGQADYDEEVWVNMSFYNFGLSDANQVSLVLNRLDTLVTLLDSLHTLAYISSGDTLTIDSVFCLQINPNSPEMIEAYLELRINEDTLLHFSPMSIPIETPKPGFINRQIMEASGNGNGLFEPGELGSVHVNLCNTGQSSIQSAHITLQCDDTLFTLVDSSVTISPWLSDDTLSVSFSVRAHPLCPVDYFTDFTIKVSDNLRRYDALDLVVHVQNDVLVIDLDGNTNSAPAILHALSNSGIQASYSLEVPYYFNDYQAIFICLGSYPNAHELTALESENLVTFLQNGGNLYMEGGDTWYFDDPVPLHDYFHIIPVSDGNRNGLSTIAGKPNTFTEGFVFSYAGDNLYQDWIQAGTGAFVMLENTDPEFATAVAYDEGLNYKTIGASHEFGGLVSGGSSPNHLMSAYLKFFDLSVTNNWEGYTIEWFESQNWSIDTIPDENINVFIPELPKGGNLPQTFLMDTIRCKSLKLDTNVVFTIPATKILIIKD